jgi:hypothetical protein
VQVFKHWDPDFESQYARVLFAFMLPCVNRSFISVSENRILERIFLLEREIVNRLCGLVVRVPGC